LNIRLVNFFIRRRRRELFIMYWRSYQSVQIYTVRVSKAKQKKEKCRRFNIGVQCSVPRGGHGMQLDKQKDREKRFKNQREKPEWNISLKRRSLRNINNKENSLFLFVSGDCVVFQCFSSNSLVHSSQICFKLYKITNFKVKFSKKSHFHLSIFRSTMFSYWQIISVTSLVKI